MPNPVKTPPNAADWGSTEQYWKGGEPVGKSKPGTLPTAERPPAKEAKKKSGKISAGISSALLLRKLWMLRQATARATVRKPAWGRRSLVGGAGLTCAPAAISGRSTRRASRG